MKYASGMSRQAAVFPLHISYALGRSFVHRLGYSMGTQTLSSSHDGRWMASSTVRFYWNSSTGHSKVIPTLYTSPTLS